MVFFQSSIIFIVATLIAEVHYYGYFTFRVIIYTTGRYVAPLMMQIHHSMILAKTINKIAHMQKIRLE